MPAALPAQPLASAVRVDVGDEAPRRQATAGWHAQLAANRGGVRPSFRPIDALSMADPNPTTLPLGEAALTLAEGHENPETLVVRVDAGISDTKVRRFRAGSPVATLTVGTQGAWKVEAPGVASVHAYLRFDGRQLLVATSDPRRPVIIDGRAAPETWSPLQPPTVLSLGQACLAVERHVAGATPPNPVTVACGRSVEDEDEDEDDEDEPTRAIRMPALEQLAEPDPLAGEDLPPAEPTRLQFGPLESSDHVGTRAVPISSLPATFLDQASSGVQRELGTRASASTPPPAVADERGIRARRLLQRGGLVLGLAVVIGGAYHVASPRTAAPAGPNVAPSAGRPDVRAVARPATPPPAIAPASSPGAAAPLFLPAPESGPSGSASGARNATTPERRAADAFAAGDFPTALRLYRELAAAHPDQPAFQQAAKILEKK
jgi:hypothetical protein